MTSSSGASSGLLADDRITAYGLLIEADRRLRRVFEQSLRESHGMTAVEFEALLRLGRSDGHLSMSELADQMVLSSGGVTRLIDRLQRDRLVERVQCPEDRRVQWAELTAEGRARIEAAVATHLEDLQRHFSSLISAEELPLLLRVLERLRAGCRTDPPGTANPA
jgi:DNA-binding MarR family transcriptional regulator